MKPLHNCHAHKGCSHIHRAHTALHGILQHRCTRKLCLRRRRSLCIPLRAGMASSRICLPHTSFLCNHSSSGICMRWRCWCRCPRCCRWILLLGRLGWPQHRSRPASCTCRRCIYRGTCTRRHREQLTDRWRSRYKFHRSCTVRWSTRRNPYRNHRRPSLPRSDRSSPLPSGPAE